MLTLGKQVMGPLAEALRDFVPGVDAVTLIPAGLLALLPLHAARYHRDGQVVSFLDEFTVTYSPSAMLLGFVRREVKSRRRGSMHLVGVANPLPHPQPPDYAQVELEEIASLFSGKKTLLYEGEATKAALLRFLLQATHVHLACHSRFDLENPLNDHIQLAHSEPLTLREWMDRGDLSRLVLVVLSACQMAITKFSDFSNEIIGLPTGLMMAGVPWVVGTLWPVNDLSTALVMIKFYEYHLHGDLTTGEGPMPPARALRQAQRWLRDVTVGELLAYFQHHKTLHDAQYHAKRQLPPEEVVARGMNRLGLEDPQSRPFAHPYYWVPFTLMGVIGG